MNVNMNGHSNSRRKFIKVAAITAYVAPAIMSLPAHATFKNTGSAPTKKKVWPKHKSFRRVYRYRRYAYRNYRSYGRYRSYRSAYRRRW